ncbi:MAG: 3-phosphoshikimate 1-carboxyvinyltransferase [Gaiella sp.]
MSGILEIEPLPRLAGHLRVPGDKSISHRAVLLGAIGDGTTRVTGFGRSADTQATVDAVRALGVEVVDDDEETLVIHGVGLRGLEQPAAPIDCGNAGTLVRLLAGILAGQERKEFELVGDESLSRRPMSRITDPLALMGAVVETAGGGLPLRIQGRPLTSISYKLPVASAQVKSAVLLAGLYARDGETTVVEPEPTRDHTERMLEAAGVRVERRPGSVTVWPSDGFRLGDVEVPGDFSSAAPFIVAATVVPGSEIHLHGINLNPRRTGLLDILDRMGAHVTIYNRREIGGEPGGDLEVRSAELVATRVSGKEVPSAVDELPLFALAAAVARGESRLKDASELRAKESDRIEAVVDGLKAVGARIRSAPDGFVVRGIPTRPRGGRLESRGDHRIAMLGAVAGLASQGGVRIVDADCVDVSFPTFFELLDRLGAEAEGRESWRDEDKL